MPWTKSQFSLWNWSASSIGPRLTYPSIQKRDQAYPVCDEFSGFRQFREPERDLIRPSTYVLIIIRFLQFIVNILFQDHMTSRASHRFLACRYESQNRVREPFRWFCEVFLAKGTWDVPSISRSYSHDTSTMSSPSFASQVTISPLGFLKCNVIL